MDSLKKQGFSVRKYSVGTASVLLGTAMLGTSTPTVSASTYEEYGMQYEQVETSGSGEGQLSSEWANAMGFSFPIQTQSVNYSQEAVFEEDFQQKKTGRVTNPLLEQFTLVINMDGFEKTYSYQGITEKQFEGHVYSFQELYTDQGFTIDQFYWNSSNQATLVVSSVADHQVKTPQQKTDNYTLTVNRDGVVQTYHYTSITYAHFETIVNEFQNKYGGASTFTWVGHCGGVLVITTEANATGTQVPSSGEISETSSISTSENQVKVTTPPPSPSTPGESGGVDSEMSSPTDSDHLSVSEDTAPGQVIVRYHTVDETGQVVIIDAIDSVVDTVSGQDGEHYDTSEYKHAESVVDGKTYVLTPIVTEDSDPEQGLVTGGTTKIIHYYYVEKGSVPPQPATGTPADSGKNTPIPPSPSTPGESGGVAPETSSPTDSDHSSVSEDTAPGQVIVRYHTVDETGQVVIIDAIDSVVDTVSGQDGEHYDTSEYKHAEIVVDGKTYVLTPIVTEDSDPEQGLVTGGTTKIIHYYYVEKGSVSPQPATGTSGDSGKNTPIPPSPSTPGESGSVDSEMSSPTDSDHSSVSEDTAPGQVIVRYHTVDETGQVVIIDAIDSVVDTVSGQDGEHYDTSEYKHAEIVVDGKTYVLTPIVTEDSDPEQGLVTGGTTKIIHYYYVEKGSVSPQPATPGELSPNVTSEPSGVPVGSSLPRTSITQEALVVEKGQVSLPATGERHDEALILMGMVGLLVTPGLVYVKNSSKN